MNGKLVVEKRTRSINDSRVEAEDAERNRIGITLTNGRVNDDGCKMAGDNLLRDRAKSALQRSLANHVPAEEVPLAGTDLVATLEARDKLNRLQNALVRLKPRTREIFLAHRLDGMSYKQIAERSGLSVKGVEWHMSKAIDHLDRALRR